MQKRFVVIIFASLFAIILTAGCIGLKDLFENINFENVSTNYSTFVNDYSITVGNDSLIVSNDSRVVNDGSEYEQPRIRGGLYGVVTDMKKTPLIGVFVSLTREGYNYSNTTDEYGKYNLTEVPAGIYVIVLEKEGYVNVTLPNVTIVERYQYSWNVNLVRDCLYYFVNASASYVIRYGCNGTIYRGDMECTMPYPEEATYLIYPEVDDKLSSVSVSYLGENRMLSWKLDNSDWDYSYVEGYAYIDMKGTRTMQIVARKEIAISAAASGQPNYLGSGMLTDRVSKKKRAMIDPSDNEIKEMAERLKNETGSDDTWTVARAIFLWLKEKNQYYHGPESDNYTQSAIETLHNKRGDCDELSYLYISLLRAAGIPARYVDGYLVSSNTSAGFISHTWVEFYDGKWVPVEVADTGLFGQEEANWDADSRMGIQLPDHISIFVDDGSEDMRSGPGAQWIYNYYDKLPSISDYTYFDSVSYDPMYLTVCEDGTRTLAKDKE